jgi:hypothetical protein
MDERHVIVDFLSSRSNLIFVSPLLRAHSFEKVVLSTYTEGENNSFTNLHTDPFHQRNCC